MSRVHAICAERASVQTNVAAAGPKDALDAAQSDADLAVVDKKERRRVHLVSRGRNLFDLLASLNNKKGCRRYACACFVLAVVKMSVSE